MSLCPGTVASSGQPLDLYFPLVENLPPAQVLSQAGNTVSLSGGGGSVNVASTTSVASSAQKLTAVTYNTGLLETNVAGVLNVGLGSAIGSTRVEGAKVIIQRDPGEPQIEFVKGLGVERIKYDGTKLLMGPVDISGQVGAQNMVLTSDLGKVTFNNGLGVLKGEVGYNVATDFTKLTGVAGVEINTTAGPINIEANGDKINMTTNGNNIEIFGNTTGGFFADVNIGTADGDLDMAIGGNITMNAGTTGGNITVTAFGDFSVSSTTVKLPTLPPASTANQLFYDTSTKEVSYGPAFPAITVQAATGTIALTEAMNRATYILTGISATQSFSQAGLVGVAAGWTVYLRNGNNATGLTRDITISIPAGNTTLHAPTGTTNSSYILLYWTGSVLVAYR